MDIEELIKTILDSAYQVRLSLGPGFLESVYKNAMIIELEKHHIECLSEYPINVYYDNTVVGEFRADLLVEKRVIIELKAVQTLNTAHEVQLVSQIIMFLCSFV